MLRVGTVFSGIGAFEHALKRMNIDHEIVFACDNGDVDILSKKIPVNTDSIIMNFNTLEVELKSVKVENDFIGRKNELIERLELLKASYIDFCESTEINMNDKKTEKKIRDYSERLSMIFELYETMKIHNDLSKITDYSEQKKYVGVFLA